MTILLIIIGIIGTLIGAFIISSQIGIKRMVRENKEICEAHKKLGYPELNKETQFKIMETGDFSPIAELIPDFKDKGTPSKLLRHYIKASRKEFKEYLIRINFLDKQKIENAPNPKHDGIWIKDKQIIDQERGNIHRTWNFSNDDDAINVYIDLLWKNVS